VTTMVGYYTKEQDVAYLKKNIQECRECGFVISDEQENQFISSLLSGSSIEEVIFSLPSFEELRKREKTEESYVYHKDIRESYEKCPKCGSSNVKSEQQQKRSADEGMTVFYLCLSCKNRWTR